MTIAASPASRYTHMLAKGGAMLAETRILLRAWHPGMSEADLFARALQDDLLGQATAYRARVIVSVVAMRYLRPNDSPARHLQRIVERDTSGQLYSDLVFYYTVRRDGLLRDFTVLRYWPFVRDGRLILTNRDAEQLIREGETDGRISSPWTEQSKRRMARVVMAALTDVGLLGEFKPGKREVLPYRVADGTVVYLAYLLHNQGVTDASLANHADWALYGLEPGDVWNRLEALASEAWFVVQRAGQVARISWRYASMEEVVDALAG